MNISFEHHRVVLDGMPVTLTRKEYELLALLSQHPGETLPRDVLLRQVWGYGEGIRTRTLDVHIRRLRKKLAPLSVRYIETIFGVGYRFQPYRQRATPYPFERPVSMTAIA